VIWSTCKNYTTEPYQGHLIPNCIDHEKGHIELWVDGIKKVDLPHFTLYPNVDSPYGTGKDQNGDPLGKGVYLKQGIYRNSNDWCAGVPFPNCARAASPSDNIYQTIFHDRMLIFSSR
jgi:hypothetical protein